MIKKLNSAKQPKDATMYKISENEPLFAMAKIKENEIIILCGKYRVSTKTFKTYEEAENYISSKPYELLINVAVLFAKLNEYENAKQEIEKLHNENMQVK